MRDQRGYRGDAAGHLYMVALVLFGLAACLVLDALFGFIGMTAHMSGPTAFLLAGLTAGFGALLWLAAGRIRR